MSTPLTELLKKISAGNVAFRWDPNIYTDARQFDQLVDDVLELERRGFVCGVTTVKNSSSPSPDYDFVRVARLTRLGWDELNLPWWRKIGTGRWLQAGGSLVGIIGGAIWFAIEPSMEPAILFFGSTIGFIYTALFGKSD